MKKIVILIMVVVLIAGIVKYSNDDNVNSARINPIKVGAILPMTGELAFVGQEIERGMRLAILDNSDVPVELIVEDNETANTKAAVSSLNKLLSVDNVNVVLNDVVNTIEALDPILESNKVPGIVVWDSNEDIGRLSEYTRAVGFSNEYAGRDMARFAKNNIGLSNVTVISAEDPWSDIISKSFIKEFRQIGGVVPINERLQVGTIDYRTSVAKAMSAGSDAIYSPLFPQDINVLIKQARELGFEGQFIAADSFSDFNIEVLGALSDGIYFTSPWLEDDKFLNDYVEVYGGETSPINLSFAALGYDAVEVVVEVAKNIMADGKKIGPETIHEYLEQVDLKGLTGNVLFNSNRTTDKRQPILIVERGELKLAKQF